MPEVHAKEHVVLGDRRTLQTERICHVRSMVFCVWDEQDCLLDWKTNRQNKTWTTYSGLRCHGGFLDINLLGPKLTPPRVQYD